MSKQVYDSIALEYKNSKNLSFRKYIETYTLFQIAGDIKGLDVIDLACGEGFYTRKLKRAGAQFVGGVDISEEMIELAEQNEKEIPLGCKYTVHDVAQMPVLGTYDLAVAMYLLNYARSRAQLLEFCRAAYRQLRPGARFIGVNDNPFNELKYYGTYRPYGFIKKANPDRKEGDPIHYTFFNEDGNHFHFDNYYLHPETYREVFEMAGFCNFKWEPLRLDPSQNENLFWDHFLLEPPVIGFSAKKK